jgi:hypothetical protein
MGLRDRIGGGGGGPAHYQMQQKLFSIGDDAWITDEARNRFFKDGKALRARSTFILEDANGNEVASIQEQGQDVGLVLAIVAAIDEMRGAG